MSKHFFDKANGMSKHAISCAAIIDSSGNLAGRIIVRFTDSQIGWNHEVGVNFHPADLDFSRSLKGGTYNNPGTLYYLLHGAGVKCYDWHRNQLADYSNRDKISGHVMQDSLSRFSDICYIKHGRKSYRLDWLL